MKKRLLSLFLCLVMVFSLLPSFTLAANAETIRERHDDGEDDILAVEGSYSGEANTKDNAKNTWENKEGAARFTLTGRYYSSSYYFSYADYVYFKATVIVDENGKIADVTMECTNTSDINNLYCSSENRGNTYYTNALATTFSRWKTSENSDNGYGVQHWINDSTYGLVSVLKNGSSSYNNNNKSIVGIDATYESLKDFLDNIVDYSNRGNAPNYNAYRYTAKSTAVNLRNQTDVYTKAYFYGTQKTAILNALLAATAQADPEPDPTKGETWIYTLATPSDSSKGWTTTDSYKDLYYYDAETGNYYPVKTDRGDTYVYGAYTPAGWTASEIVQYSPYYLDERDGRYYPAGTTSGVVYAPATVTLSESLIPQAWDASSIGAWHTQYYYSVTNYYVYDADWGIRHLLVRHYGWTYLVAGGYTATFYYLRNEGSLDMTPGKKDDGDSSKYLPSTGYRIVQFNSKDSVDYERDWAGLGSMNSARDGGATPNVQLYSNTNGPNNMVVHTDNGDVYGTQATLTTDTVYPGYLYYRDTEQGAVQLYYQDGGDLTKFGQETPYYGDKYVKGDVLYTGTLYTRHIGQKGDLVGYKSLSDRQADGSYNLTIDSWATGEAQGYETAQGSAGTPDLTTKTETTVQKKVPLDVVLVIDQSGSMGTADMGETIQGYDPVTPANGSTWTEKEINNGTTYYCKVGDTYYPVKTESGNVYTKADSRRGNKMFSYGHDGVSLVLNGSPVHFNVPTNYYINYNGEMHKLYIITVGKDLEYGLYPYIYTNDNSTYAKKAEWTKGIYWVAVFRPWSAKLLKDDSDWKNAVSGIRWVNSNGQTLDPTDSNGDSVKTEYRRVLGVGLTDAYYIKNLYTVSDTATTALYYTDESGQKVPISNTRTMGEDTFTLDGSKCDGKLYTVVSDSTRIQALRKAVETFTEELAANAEEYNVNHRLAIVGFAGNKFPGLSSGETAVHGNTTKYDYTDTGIFLNNGFINYGNLNGTTPYTKVDGAASTDDLYINKHYYIKSGDSYQPIAYEYSSGRWYNAATNRYITTAAGRYSGTFYRSNLDDISAAQYQNALVKVLDAGDSQKYNYADHKLDNTPNKVNDVLDQAIDNFGYYGGTYTSYGLAMANNIFANNPVGTGAIETTVKVTENGEETRNETTSEPADGERIIVVFTDGEPGANGYDANIANEALAGGVESKMTNGYGAKVYTVGLYPNGVAQQVENFMHQLSSEYTANIQPVGAGSDFASKTTLNGSSTYYYKDTDGKFYAVTATRNGVSSLGWWQHNANGSLTLLNVEGKNGAGEHAIYSDKNNQNQVYGEDANVNTVYYRNGNEVRYEYRWYDADRSIVTPNLGTSGTETGRVQFYEIKNQTANADGESYYTRVTTGQQLADAFTSIVNSIKVSEDTTVVAGTPETPAGGTVAKSYGGSDTVIRDVINAAFDLNPNATVEIQLVPSNGLGEEVTQDGKTFKRPNAGTGTTVVSTTQTSGQTPDGETISYTLNRDTKTIDITGFDFSKYYIADGHDGKFLRVIISGLSPNGVGTLYSNTNRSAIYAKNEDGTAGDQLFTYNNPSVIVEDYTVTWINGDQTLETDYNVPFNATPAYDSGDPIRAPKSEEREGQLYTTTYTFKGWSENAEAAAEDTVNLDNEKITKDTTYYAIFTESTVVTRTQFKVVWHNNGVLETDDPVAAGTVPEYHGAEPTNGDMVFVGWTTDPDDTTLTNARIDASNFPKNFSVAPNLPVEYYPANDGVVNFYAVFMDKGKITEQTQQVVVEYSVKNEIAEGVYEFETVSAPAGDFTKDMTETTPNGDEVGKLFFTPKMQQESDFAYDLTPLSKVNVAKYYTGASVAQWNADKTLTTVTVIPGSSVYLDDSLVSTPAYRKDGSASYYDYEAALAGVNVNDTVDVETGSTLTFTFTGSRIDVYCTTTESGKTVRAYVQDESGKILKSVSMRNQSSDTRYNVPTLSFDLGEVGTYTLVVRNSSDIYKLDGVRIYHPYADNSKYAADEQNAHFINLRDKLKDALEQQIQSAGDTPITDTIAFFTDKGLQTPANYLKEGPKNEIYLSNDETVAFEIQNFASYPETVKVMVGLSVQGSASTSVTLNGNAKTISAVTDAYYPVTVTRDAAKPDVGIVSVTNNGDAVLAITNLKISGLEDGFDPAVAAKTPMAAEANAQAFEPVVMVSNRLMVFMQNPVFTAPETPADPDATEEPKPEPSVEPTAEPTAAPTPTPTKTPTLGSLIQKLVSSFVSSLFNSISRLFGK